MVSYLMEDSKSESLLVLESPLVGQESPLELECLVVSVSPLVLEAVQEMGCHLRLVRR
jgi:hypothetical protein